MTIMMLPLPLPWCCFFQQPLRLGEVVIAILCTTKRTVPSIGKTLPLWLQRSSCSHPFGWIVRRIAVDTTALSELRTFFSALHRVSSTHLRWLLCWLRILTRIGGCLTLTALRMASSRVSTATAAAGTVGRHGKTI